MALVRLILAGLAAFVIITVVAFVYLPWWQAMLVSAGTFFLFVYGARWFALSMLRKMTGMAGGLFDTKSRVLRGARVDVHSVRRLDQPPEESYAPDDEGAPTPEEIAEDRAYALTRDWYEIEATIFPDPAAAGRMEHWDLYDLMIVPAGAKPIDLFALAAGKQSDDEESAISDIAVVENGQPRDPGDGKVVGPQRVRFVVDLPRGLTEAKFRYFFEQFGLIRLPGATPPALT